MARKTDPSYGNGVVRLGADDEVLLDEEQIVRRLREMLGAPDYEPPTLPAVALELIALSQKADVSLDEVASLVERDSLIAGRVMKLVHSPIYSGANPIGSLRDALVRIGLKTLRDLVMQVALGARVFRSDAYAETMELLRRHSLATAHLSRIVSRYSPLCGEHAFLCGLLHDVGIAGSLLCLADCADRKEPPSLVAIWPAIDRVHAEAGVVMGRLWNLPAEIQLVIGAHHQVLLDGHAHPLAATVALANQLALEWGYDLVPREGNGESGLGEIERACLQTHSSVDRSRDAVLESARAALRLSDAQWELVRADFEKVRGEIA